MRQEEAACIIKVYKLDPKHNSNSKFIKEERIAIIIRKNSESIYIYSHLIIASYILHTSQYWLLDVLVQTHILANYIDACTNKTISNSAYICSTSFYKV